MLSAKQISAIKSVFSCHPIEKAWVFGSFARNEETKHSDVDILVKYIPNSHVTLFTVGGIYSDLTDKLKREVDLVEEGYLYPYAVATANRDKILIYERKS